MFFVSLLYLYLMSAVNDQNMPPKQVSSVNDSVRYVAYLRVSTDKQGTFGFGMEAQQEAIHAFVKQRGELLTQFVEVESGKKRDRPELGKAISLSQKKKAILLIARLDRLARNVAFISNLLESKVDFVACDMPEANRFTIHILAAVAEHERELISKRTKEALRAAKRRGVKLGNPHAVDVLPLAHQATRKQADHFARGLIPFMDQLLQQKCTLTEIARIFNQRGIPTARRRRWHRSTIVNLQKRKGKPAGTSLV